MNYPTKLLIFIPARAGSKRLKGKNLRRIGGRTLIDIADSTAGAVCCRLKDDSWNTWCVISTDIPKSELCPIYSFVVPRPIHLATDSATIYDTIDNFITTTYSHSESYSRSVARTPDMVLILQPSNPFRSANTIAATLEIAREMGKDFISYRRVQKHSLLQDMPSGDFYALHYPLRHKLWRQVAVPSYTVDINTLADLRRARKVYQEEYIKKGRML